MLQRRLNQIAFYVGIIAFILMLSACSRSTYFMKSSGQLDKAVSFSFYDIRADTLKQARTRVTKFVVQEKSETSDWKTVWELSGNQKVEVITYGVPVDGLDQIVPAQPLNLHARYRAFACDEKVLFAGPECDYEPFAFDAVGQIVEIKPPM